MREKILELKKRIFADTLAKGFFIITGGSIIGQLVGILATPVLTRLFSPEDFGVLGLFSSTLAILAIAGGFKYDSAFPLPKDDEDAANLFVFFLIVLSVTTIAFIVIGVLLGEYILSVFRIDKLNAYIMLLVLGFFGAALTGGLTMWVTRRRDYARITYTKMLQSSGGAVSKILLGLVSAGPLGLIIGHILSQVLGIGTLVRYMWERDRAYFKDLSFSRMKINAKRYIQFPLYSFPAGVVNALALQLPVFMLTAIYGLDVVGMYSLAYSVLVASSMLVSSSIVLVYAAEVSKMIRENSTEIKNLYLSTTRKLLTVGIPLIIIPSLLAPFLFPLIFGEEWAEAGLYCLPLAILALANFVVAPTSMLLLYGFNHWTLIWDTSRILLVFLSFYVIQVLSLPVMTALFIYSGVMALMYVINYLMNVKAIGLYLQRGS